MFLLFFLLIQQFAGNYLLKDIIEILCSGPTSTQDKSVY